VLTRGLDELKRNWRFLVGTLLTGAAVYVAVTLSDRQGRADVPSGYAVRMTCEKDPESYLWSGGCERVAADIARTERPDILDLYRAFVTVHHRMIPSPRTQARFRGVACEEGFEVRKAVEGTRFILSPDAFRGVCTRDHAAAIMDEIDRRDRALLKIERAGLSWQALAAGAVANLTEPLVLFGAACVVAALYLL
jgi:hypothetical protein